MAKWDMEVPGYRLCRLVAEGGMASVYLAVQESLGRNVALKLLKKFDAPAETERFLNEGRIISSLNHRNIITIHDIGLVGERPFISMEFLEGGDLEDKLATGVDTKTALDLLETLVGCLDFVHQRGIIHRDIKPANILFHADGTPILTDFGIAKELQTDTALTQDGTAVGSPHYLSPEQAQCQPLSGRADIYSLGVVFYQMLAGARPYDGDSAVAIMLSHLSEPVPRLPAEKDRFQPLIDRMMAKSPEDRFGSAAELLANIRTLRAQMELSELSAPSASYRCRAVDRRLKSDRGRLALGAAGSGLAAVALLSVVGTPWSPQVTQPGEVPSPVSPSTIQQEVEDPTPGISEVSRAVTETDLAKATPEVAESNSVLGNETTRAESEVAVTMLDRPSERDVAVEQQPSGISESSRAQQVELYLRLARQALADYRLTTPRGDNASFYLRRALELAPDNEEARRGLTTVANTYADLVEGALDRFNYVYAKRYLGRGLSVQPDNPRLLALKGRTRVHRDAPKRLVKEVKSWF